MQDTMPYDDRDEETGQFNPTYIAEDFIDALEAIGHEAGTEEVREEVGCAYRTAHDRLSKLDEEGRVTSRKVGQAMLWSLPENTDAESNNQSTNE